MEPKFTRVCAADDLSGHRRGRTARLLDAHVTIIGVGATGSVLANHLARAGVGHLRIVDRDFVELNNLQRQILYDEDDVAQMLPKAVAAARKLRRINSTIEIEDIVTDVNASNIAGLSGCGRRPRRHGQLHHSLPAQRRVRQAGQAVGLLWRARVVRHDAHGSAWPHTLPALHHGRVACARHRCHLRHRGHHRADRRADGLYRGSRGHQAPCGQGPGQHGHDPRRSVGCLFDKFELGPPRPDCPTCGTASVRVPQCGGRGADDLAVWSDAVQVSVTWQPRGDSAACRWAIWRSGCTLGGATAVHQNGFLLRATVDGHEFTVFPDGRAIIKGTAGRGRGGHALRTLCRDVSVTTAKTNNTGVQIRFTGQVAPLYAGSPACARSPF